MSGKRTPHTTDLERGPALAAPASASFASGAARPGRATTTDDELALLSAFLDGELSASDEERLLDTLSQRPDLQDALDALAQQVAGSISHNLYGSPVYGSDGSDDALAGFDVGGLIAARVMAELDPTALPADIEAAETLAQLAWDGASTPAQDRRLDQLLETPSSQQQGLADAVASFVAAADVARAATSVDDAPAFAAALQSMPEHVLARVERTERGWALSAAAVDGELAVVEASELVGLCGADDGIFDELSFQVQHGAPAMRHLGEALRAAADSPQMMRFAERAGAAALQAITANTVNEAAAARADAARATKAANASTTTTTTTESEAAPSLVERLRGFFSPSSGMRAFGSFLGATAALFAFVIISRGGETTTPETPKPTPAGTLAAVQQAFIDAGEPLVLADNHSVPTAELAVIGDNTADVETIDATGTTMVFSTAESNITVIWVAGLDDETDKEQGT